MKYLLDPAKLYIKIVNLKNDDAGAHLKAWFRALIISGEIPMDLKGIVSQQRKTDLKEQERLEAIELIDFFNHVCHKKSKYTQTNMLCFSRRLNDRDVTVERIKQVICFKDAEWRKDTVMNRYIAISTFTYKDNLHKYLDEIDNLSKKDLADLTEIVAKHEMEIKKNGLSEVPA